MTLKEKVLMVGIVLLVVIGLLLDIGVVKA